MLISQIDVTGLLLAKPITRPSEGQLLYRDCGDLVPVHHHTPSHALEALQSASLLRSTESHGILAPLGQFAPCHFFLLDCTFASLAERDTLERNV